MDIYAVLVNYNGVSDTIACVESLQKSTTPIRIIIVDNYSTDSSYETLYEKSKTYSFDLIKSKKNGGFAYGNNIGIRRALDLGADYILLINNDTLVVPDFLEHMLKGFEHHDVGLVTSLIMYEDQRDTIWAAGGKFDKHRMVGLSPYQGKSQKVIPASGYVDFASGCCMLIKRAVFDMAGLLPEEYFMYFEDLDYCLKIQHAGYRLWYEKQAVIYHKVSASSGGEDSPFSVFWLTKSHLRFIRTYKDECSLNGMEQLYIYARKIGKVIEYLLRGKKEQAKAIVKGLQTDG